MDGPEKLFAAIGKSVLMLQGPNGPFFRRLAHALRAQGRTVQKINFNAGDWWYFRDGLNFRARLAEWPAYFDRVVHEHFVDTVLLFGDCRIHHRMAIERVMAYSANVRVFVFEEGYIRPHHYTFEAGGVNANSEVMRKWDPERAEHPRHVQPVPSGFAAMVRASATYALAATLGGLVFPHYRHHRSLSPVRQGALWLSGYWRRQRRYAIDQRKLTKLVATASERYFAVPLQVHNDAQILEHSDYLDVSEFIAQTIDSFAQHAPPGTYLVFKHHPMDRPFRCYAKLISEVARRHGIDERIVYGVDFHLPTLLRHALGTVVINSTAGLEALQYGKPTKVTGRAFYDVPGLTAQCSLDRFWQECERHAPRAQLIHRFRNFLIRHTQINGNLYHCKDSM